MKQMLKCSPEIYSQVMEGIEHLDGGIAEYLAPRIDSLKEKDPGFFKLLELYRGMAWEHHYTLLGPVLIRDIFEQTNGIPLPRTRRPNLHKVINKFRGNPLRFVRRVITGTREADPVVYDILGRVSNTSISRIDATSAASIAYRVVMQELGASHIQNLEDIELEILDRRKIRGYELITQNPEVDFLVTPFAEKSIDREKVYASSCEVYRHIYDKRKGNLPQISRDLGKTTLEPYWHNPLRYIRERCLRLRDSDSELNNILIKNMKSTKYSKQEVLTLGLMIHHLFESSDEVSNLERSLQ